MGPFFFLTSQRLKKEKKGFSSQKAFNTCDLIHSQSSWGVLGEGRCHCPHFTDEGMPPERLRSCWGGVSHIYSKGRKEDLHFLFSRLASSSESIGPVARYTHLPNSSYLPTSQKVKVRDIKKKKSKKRKTAQRPIGV